MACNPGYKYSSERSVTGRPSECYYSPCHKTARKKETKRTAIHAISDWKFD